VSAGRQPPGPEKSYPRRTRAEKNIPDHAHMRQRENCLPNLRTVFYDSLVVSTWQAAIQFRFLLHVSKFRFLRSAPAAHEVLKEYWPQSTWCPLERSVSTRLGDALTMC